MRGALMAVLLLCSSVTHAVIVPDDYATVQAAIDAVGSAGVIQVRPGTYPESLTIVDAEIFIEGLGGRPVISPGAGAKGIVARGDTTRLTLQDVAIVGASVGVVAKVSYLAFGGVDIAGCSKGAVLKANFLVIGDSDFSDNRSFGLRASGMSPFIGRITASRNTGDGAKIKHVRSTRGSDSGNLNESSFDDNGKNGLIYVDRDRSRLDANQASRNGAAGIRVVAKEDVVWLEGNRADDNGTYGFHLRGNVPDEPSLTGAGNSAAGNGTQDVFIQQF